MHQIILFRGGMCGDILLSMLDKAYVSSIYPLKQHKERTCMKKFYNYSVEEKLKYFNKMEGYTLSHDTDFCKTLDQEQVIQIFCSDLDMLSKFADRFWTKNDYESVAHVKTDLNLNQDYTLKEDLYEWQTYHVFKHRFDIKNVYKPDFVQNLETHFTIQDIDWAKTVHKLWLTSEQQ